jgi:hypothetical protein
MLAHLTTLTILGIIFVNLIGLALASCRLIGHYPLARVTSPALLALCLFFIEHIVGLGTLRWCWPLTTAASAWIVWRDLPTLRQHWRSEATFAAAFAWVFAWRFSYPGIVASSEKIGDLAMISSYLPGTRLPPIDAWFPPFPFDVYYSFQHYAAALLGRWLALGPGLTYNLAFCLVVALTISAAAFAVHLVCNSLWRTVLVTAAFAIGGTGASIPIHFITPGPQLYASMRFIGDVATPSQVTTPFGRWLLEKAAVTTEPQVKLPTETFAYLTSLGDYHPPLSGFYLLALALLCIALIEGKQAEKPAHALLAASIPPCAIANGWTLPLQGLLVATWLCYRVWDRRTVDWRMLGAGLVSSGLLCYPFLSTFAYRAADYNVVLGRVPPGEHTPILLGLIVLWPLLAMIAVPLAARDRRGWVIWSAAFWLVLLVVAEVFYIDDIYSGIFNRFNTTLKWWAWIQAGALLVLGGYGLRSSSRLARAGTGVILVVVAMYGVDLGRQLVSGGKADFGRLDGTAAVTDDPVEKGLLEYLRAQPPAIVLQRPEAGAFTPAPALTLFAGHRAFLGWAEHEKLWRGQRLDVELRNADVKKFYSGDLPDSAGWLQQNEIEHVLWLKTDYTLPKDSWSKIHEQIRSTYFWREYYRVDDFRVGIWSRRPVSEPGGSSPVNAAP